MNQAINLIDEMIEEPTMLTNSIEMAMHNWRIKWLRELKDKLSSLPSDTQWIDVKEDPGQAWEYLIFDPEDSRCTDYFIRWKWEYTNPTHWMPLPTPPNN